MRVRGLVLSLLSNVSSPQPPLKKRTNTSQKITIIISCKSIKTQNVTNNVNSHEFAPIFPNPEEVEYSSLCLNLATFIASMSPAHELKID